ncbi:MAG: zinc ribbon domain-containing protein [Pseudomonadota bacterium]
MALIKCVECRKKVSLDAATCPHCGTPNFKPTKRKTSVFTWIVGGFLAFIFLPIIVTTLFGGKSETQSATTVQQSVSGREQRKAERIATFDQNRASILAKVKEHIDNQNFIGAYEITIRYLDSGDAELVGLHEIAANALSNARIQARTDEIVEQLRSIPESEFSRNRELYVELVELNPNNDRFEQRLWFYNEKIAEVKRSEAQVAAVAAKRVADQAAIKREIASSGPFAESDFYFDVRSAPYKDAIIKGVNRIARENKNCKIKDPSSAAVSSSRGTPDNPVFFVTCDGNRPSSNVWFSLKDVQEHASVTSRHIGRSKALELCESAAKREATNPATVDFSTLLDVAVKEFPDGRTRLMSSFTAENSFGVESKYRINCMFDSNSLLEAHLFDSE